MGSDRHEGLYGRLYALLYDRLIRAAEAAGLRRMRAELLGEAAGRTVEIGAGTGLNLEHYPPAVTELVLVEPSRQMAAKLRRRVAAGARRAEVVESGGEALPLADGAADTVVVTLVLCTTPDPGAVLREAGRVLRPGGRLLFLEHVRSRDPRVARWQDRLDRPWKALGNGCHCNRDTRATIEASPLALERIADTELPLAGPLARPAIVGIARR